MADKQNPDMRLLGTSVCHASSEDESFPANELNQAAGNAPHMAPRGWQCAKLGDFPQEIGVKFDSNEVFVQQIQLLAHQSKTPTRVDIFVYPAPSKNSASPSKQQQQNQQQQQQQEEDLGGLIPSYHDVNFHRLGYVTFRNNEVTKYRTRERKTVQLNVKAMYLRLVLHKCYSNPVNLYSQVGIVALTAWGKVLHVQPVTNNNQNSIMRNQLSSSQQQQHQHQQHQQDLPPVRAGGGARQSTNISNMQHQQHPNAEQAMQNASHTLAPVAPPPSHSRSMNRFSAWYTDSFNALNDIKTRAVDNEDFELAKNVKERLAWLASQAAEINLLDSQKIALADAEDYQAAQNIQTKQATKIETVMTLSQNATPADSVANLVAQMNGEAGIPIITAGTPSKQQQQSQQRKNSLKKNKNINNNTAATTTAAATNSFITQPENAAETPNNNDISSVGDISGIGGSSNTNNNVNQSVTMSPFHHQQHQHQQENENNYNNNNRSPSNTPPGGFYGSGSGGGGMGLGGGGGDISNQSPTRHSFEDQPIRSKFAIEMAQMRMKQLHAQQQQESGVGNADDAAALLSNENQQAGGDGATAPTNTSLPPKVKKANKNAKKAAAAAAAAAKKNNANRPSSSSNTSNTGSNTTGSARASSQASSDNDTTQTSQSLFDDDETGGGQNYQADRDPASPSSGDNNNNSSVAGNFDSWEREVVKLVEETASARFVATSSQDDGTSGFGGGSGGIGIGDNSVTASSAAGAGGSSSGSAGGGGGGTHPQSSSAATGNYQAPSSALQQQQRAENAGAASAGLHISLGRYVAGCIFSRRWVMRESAVCTVLNHLDVFAKHAKSATEVAESMLVYCDTKGFGLLDHVPSIFGICRDFVVKLVSSADGGESDEDEAHFSAVNLQHVSSKIAGLLPRLLLKCDNAAGGGKIREEAQQLILAIANCSAIGAHGVLQYLICKPVDADKKTVNTVTARQYQVRLNILQQLYQFNYDDADTSGVSVNLRPLEEGGGGESGEGGEPVMYPSTPSAYDTLMNKLLIPCANHASSDVREPAVSILVHMLLHAANHEPLKTKLNLVLRKVENPAARATIVTICAPHKAEQEQQQQQQQNSSEHHRGTPIHGDGATGVVHHDGAQTTRVGGKVTTTTSAAAANKRPSGAGVVRGGGRNSTTPAPDHSATRLHRATTSNRNTPSQLAVDRRSATPKTGKPIIISGGAVNTNNNNKNVNNNAPSSTHPLPAMSSGDAPLSVSPSRGVGGNSNIPKSSPQQNQQHAPAAPASRAKQAAAVRKQQNARRKNAVNNNNNNNNNVGAGALSSVVGSAMTSNSNQNDNNNNNIATADHANVDNSSNNDANKNDNANVNNINNNANNDNANNNDNEGAKQQEQVEL